MKYTMKDFKTGNIAVCLNANNAGHFLRACKKAGLLWLGGEATEALYFVSRLLSQKISVSATYSSLMKSLGFSRTISCIRTGLSVVDVTSFDLGEIVSSSSYHITIDCDGKTTTARMIINGKEVKCATARCNPADKFNFKVGATVAFNRLFSREPKANDSDKFRIGDRVVCDYVVGNPLVYNKHGKILKRNNDFAPFSYAVEFDDDIWGHDAEGRGQAGHCWSINEDKLRRE